MKKIKNFPLQKKYAALGIVTIIFVFGIVSPLYGAVFSLKGETVNLIIGFPPGSSDDFGMRQLAPYLKKHLPGKPTIIVVNKPGAGGIKAANSFYQTTKGNGKTIGMFTGVTLKVALKDKSVRFDINKMHLLGIQPTNQVTLLHKNTGVMTAADLLSVKEPLIVGTSSKRAAPFMANVSFFDMLGIPHKDLTGYRGQGEILQAMRTKELTVAPLAWTRYMAMRESIIKEGIMTPIWQRGYLQGDGSIKPEPALGVPTQHEIIEKYKQEAVGTPLYRAMTTFVGLFAVGRSFWLPPKTDPEIIKVWQRAISDTYSDTGYREMIKKQTKMDVVFHNAEDGQKLMGSVLGSFNDPAVRKVIDQIMGQ